VIADGGHRNLVVGTPLSGIVGWCYWGGFKRGDVSHSFK
jgi:hypothetical protein